MTNVLIVEDEPAISDMERDFLEGAEIGRAHV